MTQDEHVMSAQPPKQSAKNTLLRAQMTIFAKGPEAKAHQDFCKKSDHTRLNVVTSSAPQER